jgi:hypothetical protein
MDCDIRVRGMSSRSAIHRHPYQLAARSDWRFEKDRSGFAEERQDQ